MVPGIENLEISGLDMRSDDVARLLEIDKEAWTREIPDIEDFFSQFGDKLPERLQLQLERLKERLES